MVGALRERKTKEKLEQKLVLDKEQEVKEEVQRLKESYQQKLPHTARAAGAHVFGETTGVMQLCKEICTTFYDTIVDKTYRETFGNTYLDGYFEQVWDVANVNEHQELEEELTLSSILEAESAVLEQVSGREGLLVKLARSFCDTAREYLMKTAMNEYTTALKHSHDEPEIMDKYLQKLEFGVKSIAFAYKTQAKELAVKQPVKYLKPRIDNLAQMQN